MKVDGADRRRGDWRYGDQINRAVDLREMTFTGVLGTW